jgi:hypothetical protein
MADTTVTTQTQPQSKSRGPSRDFDDLTDKQILDLVQKVRDAWAPRDSLISRIIELRDHKWEVAVPKAWRQTAKTQHTSLTQEIPQRVLGTLTLNDPVYTRPNPGEDFTKGSDANQVERFHQGHFQDWRKTAIAGTDSYIFMMDKVANHGAGVAGSILAPHHWAGAPSMLEDGQIRQTYWRDSSGKETDSYDGVDPEASAKAYAKSVDTRRRRAGVPLARRVLPPETCYPILVEDKMLAMIIVRKATMVELEAGGWSIDIGSAEKYSGKQEELIEVVTPNRCRYYLNEMPVAHEEHGKDGLVTGYGFVPYAYRTGLIGGTLDYGSFGLPALTLVESNLRTITTLRTYLMNAVHLASFTSFQLVDKNTGTGVNTAALVDNKTGKKLTTFEFKSGTIMEVPAGKEILPLTHPGLNQDFWKAHQAEVDEVNRVFPRTLSGQAESSGYNTALSSVQAKSILNSCYRGGEMLLEDLARMDMKHISTLPGPVYLDVEKQANSMSTRRAEFEHVRIDSNLIDDYYGIKVSIDREADRITLGQFAANLNAGGVGDDEWVADMAGITDYEDMVKRRARDRVLKSDKMMAILEEDAIDEYGLRKASDQAAARGRIQMTPDGVPMVDGQPGPGMAGANGQGGVQGNPAMQSNGGPNLASVANPTISQPTPTATNRPRGRRRGGAMSGPPQHMPQPQNPAA